MSTSATTGLKNKAKANRHHKWKAQGRSEIQRKRRLLAKIRKYAKSNQRSYCKDHGIVPLGVERRTQDAAMSRVAARKVR